MEEGAGFCCTYQPDVSRSHLWGVTEGPAPSTFPNSIRTPPPSTTRAPLPPRPAPHVTRAPHSLPPASLAGVHRRSIPVYPIYFYFRRQPRPASYFRSHSRLRGGPSPVRLAATYIPNRSTLHSKRCAQKKSTIKDTLFNTARTFNSTFKTLC